MSEGKRFLIIVPNGTADGEEHIEFLSLLHPRTGSPAKFLVQGGLCYEIQVTKEPHRSWFVDDSAIADGSLYLASQIDPLFLIIPKLVDSCKGRRGEGGAFIDMEQILTSSEEPKLHKLKECKDLRLELICDVKSVGDDTLYYRINEDRLCAWLDCKMDHLKAIFLNSSEPLLLIRGRSSSFATSRANPECDESTLTRFCASILKEYLPKDVYSIIEETYREHLVTKKLSDFAFQPSAASDHSQSSQSDYDADFDRSKKAEKKAPGLSVSQRKLAKVDKRGMKSMNHFFSKTKPSDSETPPSSQGTNDSQ